MKSDLPPQTEPHDRWRISLRALLALAFGSLVALSIGVVLIGTVRANFENTFSLLNKRAAELIAGMERAILVETERAEQAVAAIARLHSEGAFDLREKGSVDPFLRAILLAQPTIEAMLIADRKRTVTAYWKRADGTITSAPPQVLRHDMLARILSHPSTTARTEAFWGAPIRIGPTSFHFVSLPLTAGGESEGFAIAAIGIQTFNRIMVDLGRDNRTTAFLLTADNKVLAHSRLPHLFRDTPQIALSRFPDPVLQSITQGESGPRIDDAVMKNVRILATPGRDGHLFIVKPIEGFGGAPYTLGAYFEKADQGEEVFRMLTSALAGAFGLLLSVLAAILIARRLTRPLAAATGRVTRLARLEVDEYQPLPPSRIVEIDRQSQALNRLHLAVREFARYVPRRLVEDILRSGEQATRPVQREITILFTDIAGFSTLAEQMNAAETAGTLNRHFELLCRIVEDENGTVDKFLGDGLMAFWGAPDDDPKHGEHAARAAASMLHAVAVENRGRMGEGLPALRVRIGVHTGSVVVGNIGGGSRQNYTVVGDAVNVARRMEELGRIMAPDRDTSLAIFSEQAAKACGDTVSLRPGGRHKIRGRHGAVKVFVLEEPANPADR